MPFKSLKQERFANTSAGKKAFAKKDSPMQASVPKEAPMPKMPDSSLTPPAMPVTKHGFAMGGEHVEVGSSRG